jgi:hypothetical protein
MSLSKVRSGHKAKPNVLTFYSELHHLDANHRREVQLVTDVKVGAHHVPISRYPLFTATV